jgi:glycosyltransferase involved in cell wall biosynthesis
MANQLGNLRENLFRCKGLPIQILLIHDDGEDGTQEELESLLSDFGHLEISLITQTCNSPGLARNVGLQQRLANWFCFWDSDDLVRPELYLEMIELAQREKSDLAVGKIQTQSMFNSTDIHEYPLNPQSPILYLELANNPGFTRMVFKSQFFQDCRFMETKIGEDQCFLSDTNFLDFKITYFPYVIYTYFTDIPGQLTVSHQYSGEIKSAMDYLAATIGTKSNTMKPFVRAQFLKLAVGSLMKSRGLSRISVLKKISWVGMKLFLQNPKSFLMDLTYLSQNRIKLAGR